MNGDKEHMNKEKHLCATVHINIFLVETLEKNIRVLHFENSVNGKIIN